MCCEIAVVLWTTAVNWYYPVQRSRWTLNVAYAEEPPATNENYDKVLSLRGATPATGSGYKKQPCGATHNRLKELT